LQARRRPAPNTEKERDLNDRLNRLNQIANDAQQRGNELRDYVDRSKVVLANADRQAAASREESHMLLDEGKNQMRAMTEQLMNGYQSQGPFSGVGDGATEEV